MDDYAGRVLADRYRLPRPPADEYELVETRAFDTYSGQEVLVRQVLLPEVVGGEPGDEDAGSDSAHRALEAARAAAAIPDHPRLVQVFDIFVDGGSLWIVSELVSARPLAALLADKRLSPYRAAEVGSDVLTALLALHAHGWTHRNVTMRHRAGLRRRPCHALRARGRRRAGSAVRLQPGARARPGRRAR